MAAWRQAIELAIGEGDLTALAAIARSCGLREALDHLDQISTLRHRSAGTARRTGGLF
jgi:hypothetical protein